MPISPCRDFFFAAAPAEAGITATAGIGTTLCLAKAAMDIAAKKMPADKDEMQHLSLVISLSSAFIINPSSLSKNQFIPISHKSCSSFINH